MADRIAGLDAGDEGADLGEDLGAAGVLNSVSGVREEDDSSVREGAEEGGALINKGHIVLLLPGLGIRGKAGR